MTKHLYLTVIIVYLLCFFLTVIDMNWLVSLLSKDLRLLLIPFILYVLLPKKDLTFWIFLILVALNIPSDFADILFPDDFDFILGTFKIAIAIFLSILIIKKMRKQ